MSVVSIPVLIYFGKGTGYANYAAEVGNAGSSLGNLGYSSVQCSTTPIALQQLTIACPYGVIGGIESFGVNNVADNTAPANQCINDSVNSACEPDNPAVGIYLQSQIG
jgi:hypothetical protein